MSEYNVQSCAQRTFYHSITFLASINSQAAASVAGLTTMTIKKPGKTPWFLTLDYLLFSHKDSTYYLYYSGCCNGHWRKDVLEGHTLFCFNFFLQKIFAKLMSLFFSYLHLKPCEKCFLDGGSRDCSWHNIQRSNVSCISVAWWSFRHAKLTAGQEARARILAIEFVSFLSLFLSFLFLSFLLLAFFLLYLYLY